MRVRAALGVLIMLAVGAASWQRPGADEPTVARDISECRGFARADAARRYPYRGGALGLGGAGGIAIEQQQDQTNRSTYEAAQFNACMHERGYTLSE